MRICYNLIRNPARFNSHRPEISPRRTLLDDIVGSCWGAGTNAHPDPDLDPYVAYSKRVTCF